MNQITTMKADTGFPASINNFNTTADEYRYFEISSDKLSGIEIIKSEFFLVEEPQAEQDTFPRSFLQIAGMLA